VLLASVSGDIGTAEAVAQAVDAGRRVPPMLFFQSNPNAVVGHLTARWDLTGPVVCTSPPRDALADAMDGAVALVQDGDAAAVLVIAAELGRSGGSDRGVAMLVGPQSWPPAVGESDRDDPSGGGR
jgi:3-oxoacyl-(acyl-carrier-protein) synthase